MIAILKSEQSRKIQKGLFNIEINLPGLAWNNPDDKNGFFQLGRFDRGKLFPGVFVPMHPHQNDEILTYMRKGEMIHEDSEGKREVISNTRLMMMNAGAGIYHQESVAQTSPEHVELLQIFIRPAQENDQPEVQFASFDEPWSVNEWRLIAARTDAPLRIKSDVIVRDCRLRESKIQIPGSRDKAYLLHVFAGSVDVAGIYATAGNSVLFQDEKPELTSSETADLVLFELNPMAPYTRSGMYSGV